MRRSLPMCLLALLFIGGCQKDPPENREREKVAQTIPDDAFALVSLPDGMQMSALGTLLGNVDKQAAMMAPMMSAQAVKGLSQLLGGVVVEAAAPAHIVVLDPKKYPQPIVYIGKASGSGEGVEIRTIGAHNVVGAKAAVDAVAPLVPSLAAPTVLRAAVFPKRLVQAYRKEIESFPDMFAGMFGPEQAGVKKLMQMYADFALALEDNVDMVEMSIENVAGRGTFRTFFKATKGSIFDKFCAAQKPHDFDLLARLPDANPIVFDSHVVAGPAKKAVLEMTAGALDIFNGMTPERKGEYAKAIEALANVLTGEFAMSMGISGLADLKPQMNGVWLANTEGGDAKQLLDQMFSSWATGETIELAGTKQKMVYTPDAGSHAGVAYGKQTQSVEFTAGGMQPYQSEAFIAEIDGTAVMVLAQEEAMKRTIDVFKAKTIRELSPFEKRLIAAAKERKASVMMAMNIAETIPGAPSTAPTFAFLVSFSAGSMTLDTDIYPAQ